MPRRPSTGRSAATATASMPARSRRSATARAASPASPDVTSGRRTAAISSTILTTVALLWSAGCAARAFARPSGPVSPAPGAAAAWDGATNACRGVHEYRASGRLSARVASQRIPHVDIGLAASAAGDIAIEARAGSALVFKLAGSASEATLVLADGNRVVRAPAAEIVEALVGAPLGPERLLAVLTGCVSRQPALSRAERVGDFVHVWTGDGEVYLEKNGGAWRPRGGFFEALVVEYRSFAGEWPADLTIVSEPGHTPAVSISLHLEDPQANPPPAPAVFKVNVPDG